MTNCVIVVPCYNEAARLRPDAFGDFAARRSDVDFVLVNDGSRDGTLDMLRALAQRSPQRFTVVDLPRNVGKGEAVRQGMLRALAGRPRYAGYWDADLSTPLSALTEFIEVLDGRDELQIVVGSRVRMLGRTIQRQWWRHGLGRAFAGLISLTLRLPIYDTQCGAKLFRVSPLVCQMFAQPFCTNWIFDVELLERFLRGHPATAPGGAAEAIHEFPLAEWRHVHGSAIRPWHLVSVCGEWLRLMWNYRVRQGKRA